MRSRASSEEILPLQRLQAISLQPARGGWVPDGAPARVDGAEPDVGPELPAVAEPVRSSPGLGELARGWALDRLPAWCHGTLDRVSLGSLVSGALTLIALVVAAVMLLHRHEAPGYSTMSTSNAASTTGAGQPSLPSAGLPAAAPATADPASIVVDVSGRVRKPGLVTLPPGARVADAIRAAGGPLHHHEIATIDLAARVSDGQLLLVGAGSGGGAVAGAAGGDPSSGAAAPPAPVALNSATLTDLETLPGVGPVTAQRIIDWRTAHSGFTSLEQLQQVSGIGPATYADIAPLVTL
jgi:competence protein ComEA